MNTKEAAKQKWNYEELKQLATDKRRKMIGEEKENMFGLASVVVVKLENSENRKQDRDTNKEIMKWIKEVKTTMRTPQTTIIAAWKQPNDWRMVSNRHSTNTSHSRRKPQT